MALYLAFVLSNEDKQALKLPLDILKENTYAEDNDFSFYEDTSAFHITLRKLCNDDTKHKEAINVMNIWNRLYAQGTITVYADSLCQFNNSNNVIEWIGMSDIFPLYGIYQQIEQVSKELKFPLIEEQYQYTPHITIAYNIKYKNDFNRKFIPIPIEIKQMVLWAYDNKIKNVHLASIMHSVYV